MRLFRATRQTAWGWPVVVNFSLGGMSAGFYLLNSLMTILQGVGPHSESGSTCCKLLAPALTGLGFLTLAIEAGRPWRAHHLLRHLRRSWMSRESLAGAIFVSAAVLDWLVPSLHLWTLAAVAALGLLISHGLIVYRCRAMTAWNVPIMPFLFLTSGLAMGSGLMLVVSPVGAGLVPAQAMGIGPVVIGIVLALLDLAVWLFYLWWPGLSEVEGPGHAAFREATRTLRAPRSLLFTVVIGRLLPVLLLLLALSLGRSVQLQAAVAALAGLAIIVGGVGQKAGLILGARYLREIVLGQPKGDARGDEWPQINVPTF